MWLFDCHISKYTHMRIQDFLNNSMKSFLYQATKILNWNFSQISQTLTLSLFFKFSVILYLRKGRVLLKKQNLKIESRKFT